MDFSTFVGIAGLMLFAALLTGHTPWQRKNDGIAVTQAVTSSLLQCLLRANSIRKEQFDALADDLQVQAGAWSSLPPHTRKFVHANLMRLADDVHFLGGRIEDREEETHKIRASTIDAKIDVALSAITELYWLRASDISGRLEAPTNLHESKYGRPLGYWEASLEERARHLTANDDGKSPLDWDDGYSAAFSNAVAAMSTELERISKGAVEDCARLEEVLRKATPDEPGKE